MNFHTKNLVSLCVAVVGVVVGCLTMAGNGSSGLMTGIIVASAILWGCTLIASAIAEKMSWFSFRIFDWVRKQAQFYTTLRENIKDYWIMVTYTPLKYIMGTY